MGGVLALVFPMCADSGTLSCTGLARRHTRVLTVLICFSCLSTISSTIPCQRLCDRGGDSAGCATRAVPGNVHQKDVARSKADPHGHEDAERSSCSCNASSFAPSDSGNSAQPRLVQLLERLSARCSRCASPCLNCVSVFLIPAPCCQAVTPCTPSPAPASTPVSDPDSAAIFTSPAQSPSATDARHRGQGGDSPSPPARYGRPLFDVEPISSHPISELFSGTISALHRFMQCMLVWLGGHRCQSSAVGQQPIPA
jgi:hypothetical protein